MIKIQHTSVNLGTPKTVGELRKLLKKYDDNVTFKFKDQENQTLQEITSDENTFIVFSK